MHLRQFSSCLLYTSYRYFMNTNLFDHVNIDKTRTYVPNGLEEDSDKACADYNEIIRSVGGIDIQDVYKRQTVICEIISE